MNGNFLKAVLALSGVIIGIGTFAIPFAAIQGGILMSIFFLLALGAVMTIIHLMYGEIILRTEEKHRLPGYIKKYLPNKLGAIVSFVPIISLFGVILIYLIVGGKFLSILLGPVINGAFWGNNQAVAVLIFFIVGSLVILRDKNIFARAEEVFTIALIIVMLAIFVIGFQSFRFDNIDAAAIHFDKSFLVYGVIFFSLAGLSAIPEIKEIFSDREGGMYRKSIILGTAIPIIFYLVFMFGTIGISGANVTEEAISGLGVVLGERVLILGAIMGFLATITSFWAVGLTLKKIFWYDYGVNKHIAWALACFVPLVLYFAGITNFISTVGIVGGILGGIEGTVLVAVYLRAKKIGKRLPEYSLNLPSLVCYGIPVIFLLVVIYELIY